MQLTMAQFKDVYGALLRMKKMDLPTLLSFKVARNLQKEKHLADDFDTFIRDTQVKYAKRDEAGNLEPNEAGNIFIDPVNVDAYYKDYSEFMETKIDVEFLYLNEHEFSKLESIPPEVLINLGPVLVLNETE